MRAIDRKIYEKITDQGLTFDEILEIIEHCSRSELKKSFQDDCLFQPSRYFAKNAVDYLLRSGHIKKDGIRFIRTKEKKSD
jgi:hypothetical protein